MFCALAVINDYLAAEEVGFYIHSSDFDIEINKDMCVAEAEYLYDLAKDMMKTIKPNQSESDRIFNEIIIHHHYITNYSLLREYYHQMMEYTRLFDVDGAEKLMEIAKPVIKKTEFKDETSIMDRFTIQAIEELYEYVTTYLK